MQGNKKLDGFGPNVFGWNLHCAISVFDDVSMSDTGDYICWFYSTCLTLWNRSVNKYALYEQLHNFFFEKENWTSSTALSQLWAILYSSGCFGFQVRDVFRSLIDTQLVFESEGNQASW